MCKTIDLQMDYNQLFGATLHGCQWRCKNVGLWRLENVGFRRSIGTLQTV